MGGFDPLYDEAEVYQILELEDALKAIGSQRHADIARRANEVVRSRVVDFEEYLKGGSEFVSDESCEEKRVLLGALGTEWIRLGSLDSYLLQFTAKHPDDFRGLK